MSDADLQAQTKALADGLAAGDVEAIRALADHIAGPGGREDLANAVLRTVTARAARDIDLFYGAGIDWSTASDAMVKEAGQSIYNLQKLNEMILAAKAGPGRALRVWSLPTADSYFAAIDRGESLGTPQPIPIRTVPPLPSTREQMDGFFRLWGMTKGDPAQQPALMQGTMSLGVVVAHAVM